MCQSGLVPCFEPFRGLRYSPQKAPIGQVMAPPYDVISSVQRVHFASRHPANAVLVELPEPDLMGGRDRYRVAADLFMRWQSDGTLRPDPVPCLYPYRMTDTAGRTTTGVMGALGLPEPGHESDILPHEQTLPKPKSDRLDLLRATRANLSPIWGLSMHHGLTATFDPTDDAPTADAYDDEGVRHQLWVLDDRDAIEAIAAGVAAAPVVIADGRIATRRRRRIKPSAGPRTGTSPGRTTSSWRSSSSCPRTSSRSAPSIAPCRGCPWGSTCCVPARPGSTWCGPGRPTSARSGRWPRRTRSAW